MYKNVLLKTKEDIQRLSDLVCNQPYEVYVHSNDDTLMIDARSILALFALVGKRCRVVVEDYVDPKAFSKFINKCGIAA